MRTHHENEQHITKMNNTSFKLIFIRNLFFIIFLVGNSQGCREKKTTSFRLETKQKKIKKFPVVIHALRDGGTMLIEVYCLDFVRTNKFYVSFSNDGKNHSQLFAGEEWILESPKPFTFEEGMRVFLEIRRMIELYFGKQEFERIISDQERLNNLPLEEYEKYITDLDLIKELTTAHFLFVFEQYRKNADLTR